MSLRKCFTYEIIHPLCNASKGEEGYLHLLRYCLNYMESYSKERYDRGRESRKR